MKRQICRYAFTAITSVIVIMLAACGSNNSLSLGSSSPSSSDSLTGLSITPGSASLPLGTSEQLTAMGKYSNGSSSNLTSKVEWTASPSGVVTVSSSGLVQSKGQGTATVTGTSDGISSSAKVTVGPAAITSMEISPSDPSLPLGLSQQFTATATYTDGSSHEVSDGVQWTASPASNISITPDGLAKSIAKGNFTITAKNGSSSKSITGAVANPIAQSVQVIPTSTSIPKGGAQTFQALATMSDGTKQDVTSSATWQSTDPAVASTTTPGVFSAVGVGSVQIEAHYETFSSASALSVGNATIKTVTVSPSSATIADGTMQQFKASATMSDGSSQDVTNSATWTSSVPAADSVTPNGTATALATGSATITATIGGVSGSATLNVSSAKLLSILLTPLNPSLPVGGALQLQALGTFTGKTTQDLTNALSYVSSNPAIASISPSGLIQGVAAGAATLTASQGPVSFQMPVTVTPATLIGLTVTPASFTIATGTSQQLTATGTFSDGSTEDLSATAAWSTSSGPSAAVDLTGDVTGLATGSSTITATSGGLSATADANISAATINAISILPASVNLALGQSQAFTATASLSDGTSQDVTASAHWSVGNSLLANIANGANSGFLSTLTSGSTTVSASMNGVSGTANVSVSPASLVSLALTPSTLSLALGVPTSLTAIGTYSDGSTQNLTASVNWSSSNGQVVNVSAAGVVTPIAVGAATVTASLQGVSVTASVNITPATLVSIALNAVNGLLPAGLTKQIKAIGTYSDGSTEDITADVYWTSSDGTVATVNADGLVLGLVAGSTNIGASLSGVNQTLAVNVSTAALQSITVTAAENSFALGFNIQLKATGNYSDGSTQDITAAVQWSSSNSLIANVNASGLVAGVSVGAITVDATLQGVTGGLNVSVTPATLVSVQVSPGTVSIINLLLNQQFTLTGTFSDGSTQILSAGVHWSVSNGLLAIINSTGLLSPLGVGNVVVKATYGSFTSTATVTLL